MGIFQFFQNELFKIGLRPKQSFLVVDIVGEVKKGMLETINLEELLGILIF